MADWPPVIDADGHVLERQSDIRKYLEPPWNRRNTGLWPSDQPFDTDLFETLGYPGYDRGMSPAQQVEMCSRSWTNTTSKRRCCFLPARATSRSCASRSFVSPHAAPQTTISRRSI